MTNTVQTKYPRVLAVAPSTRGFGFVIMEGRETLVHWGGKSAKGDKNAQSLVKLEAMINQFQPSVIVLENASAKGSRRSPRIRKLSQGIVALAEKRNVKAEMFSREEVRSAFFPGGGSTKQALAEILAKRFPEELGSRLPPKRSAWMSEDSRMNIFDAVALALMLRLKNQKQR